MFIIDKICNYVKMQRGDMKMNVKDLTKKQVMVFCNKFNCELDEFKPVFGNKYYLRMFTGYQGPQPEFYVDENSCIGINAYSGYELTYHWVKFLDSIKSNDKSL